MHSPATPVGSRAFGTTFVLLIVLLLSGCGISRQTYEAFRAPSPAESGDTLVIGILGGRVSWNHPNRGVSRFAARLRGADIPGVHVETLENAKRHLAVKLIERVFDLDGDGVLDAAERRAARVILYGQSFGGAAVLKLARDLDEIGVPVLLTVQVDAVGRETARVPPNVRYAANLFQRDGWFVKGEQEIVAEDPERTWIIGNLQFHYQNRPIDVSSVPWYRRLFQTTHFRMDFDPEVWAVVEGLVREAIERRVDPALAEAS